MLKIAGYVWAKTGQHWWGTPTDRPPFSPRRLRTSLPHHGEWREPGRAVWRGAAPSSFAPGAFSASRSEEPAGPPSSARLPTLFRSMDSKKSFEVPGSSCTLLCTKAPAPAARGRSADRPVRPPVHPRISVRPSVRGAPRGSVRPSATSWVGRPSPRTVRGFLEV